MRESPLLDGEMPPDFRLSSKHFRVRLGPPLIIFHGLGLIPRVCFELPLMPGFRVFREVMVRRVINPRRSANFPLNFNRNFSGSFIGF